jgi:hypothetical protein
MPAHGEDAACTGAGVRKPSMKETAMGEGWWCVHYGNLNAAADAPEGRRSDAGRWPARIRLTSRRLPASDAEDFWAIVRALARRYVAQAAIALFTAPVTDSRFTRMDRPWFLT